jgi:hypothetical protein
MALALENPFRFLMERTELVVRLDGAAWPSGL